MGRSKVNGIFGFYFVMSYMRSNCDSSFDRTLEQRYYDLALKQDEDDEGGNQDQDRTGAQQGDIIRIVALEGSQPTGHRSLRWVLDEHQAKEKLVPRPDGCEDPE
jgi:hypothetical protein